MRKVSNLSEFHRAQLKALNKGCVKSPSIDRTVWNGGLQGYNTKMGSTVRQRPGHGFRSRANSQQHSQCQAELFLGRRLKNLARRDAVALPVRCQCVFLRICWPSPSRTRQRGRPARRIPMATAAALRPAQSISSCVKVTKDNARRSRLQV